MKYREIIAEAAPKLGSLNSVLKDGRALKLTLSPHAQYEGFDVEAQVDGEYAGSLTLSRGRHDATVWSATNVHVNPDFRRLGIATAMYNFAFKSGVKPIVPDSKLTPDGDAFWKKHLDADSTFVRKSGRLVMKSPKREWSPKRTIKETYFDTQVIDDETFKGQVEIFKNSSSVEFGKLMKEHGFLRGFFETQTGDFYLWQGDCLHHVIDTDGDCWMIVTSDTIEFQFDAESAELPEHDDLNDIIPWLKGWPRLRAIIGSRKIFLRFR